MTPADNESFFDSLCRFNFKINSPEKNQNFKNENASLSWILLLMKLSLNGLVLNK